MGDDTRGGLAEIKARWTQQASEYLGVANERIRAIAVGVLVLVWGIFTGKEAEELVFSQRMKGMLLWIAVGALVALACDLAEYLFGYLEAKRYSCADSTGGRLFLALRFGATALKYLTGVLAVTFLVGSLIYITFNSVAEAAPNEFTKFKGTWCGRGKTRFNDDEEMYVYVGSQINEIQVSVDGIRCGDATLHGILEAVCSANNFEFQSNGSKMKVTFHKEPDKTPLGVFTLGHCPPPPKQP